MKQLLKDGYFIDDKYFYSYETIKDFDGKNIGIYLVGKDKQEVDKAINGAEHMIDVSLILIILLSLILVGAILINIKRIVVTPINNFETGLLGFFKYINKETITVEPINIDANDEIGTMAKVVNENITKTSELISDVEMSSKEQQQGIEQINDAVNSIDQQTQQIASIASETNEVAVQTDTIAKLIVSSTDEKDFIGKDSVKAKDMGNNKVINIKLKNYQ